MIPLSSPTTTSPPLELKVSLEPRTNNLSINFFIRNSKLTFGLPTISTCYNWLLVVLEEIDHLIHAHLLKILEQMALNAAKRKANKSKSVLKRKALSSISFNISTENCEVFIPEDPKLSISRYIRFVFSSALHAERNAAKNTGKESKIDFELMELKFFVNDEKKEGIDSKEREKTEVLITKIAGKIKREVDTRIEENKQKEIMQKVKQRTVEFKVEPVDIKISVSHFSFAHDFLQQAYNILTALNYQPLINIYHSAFSSYLIEHSPEIKAKVKNILVLGINKDSYDWKLIIPILKFTLHGKQIARVASLSPILISWLLNFEFSFGLTYPEMGHNFRVEFREIAFGVGVEQEKLANRVGDFQGFWSVLLQNPIQIYAFLNGGVFDYVNKNNYLKLDASLFRLALIDQQRKILMTNSQEVNPEKASSEQPIKKLIHKYAPSLRTVISFPEIEALSPKVFTEFNHNFDLAARSKAILEILKNSLYKPQCQIKASAIRGEIMKITFSSNAIKVVVHGGNVNALEIAIGRLSNLFGSILPTDLKQHVNLFISSQKESMLLALKKQLKQHIIDPFPQITINGTLSKCSILLPENPCQEKTKCGEIAFGIKLSYDKIGDSKKSVKLDCNDISVNINNWVRYGREKSTILKVIKPFAIYINSEKVHAKEEGALSTSTISYNIDPIRVRMLNGSLLLLLRSALRVNLCANILKKQYIISKLISFFQDQAHAASSQSHVVPKKKESAIEMLLANPSLIHQSVICAIRMLQGEMKPEANKPPKKGSLWTMNTKFILSMIEFKLINEYMIREVVMSYPYFSFRMSKGEINSDISEESKYSKFSINLNDALISLNINYTNEIMMEEIL